MSYNNTDGLKLQNKACAFFLHLQETLKDFLEMNFPKIVQVIILRNIMSKKRFSCWVMDQKAIDQLDFMIF